MKQPLVTPRTRNGKIVLGLCFLGAVAGTLAFLPFVLISLPSFLGVRATALPSEVTLLDRTGAVLQMARRDATRRELPWVALSDHSSMLRDAVLASEDKRFYAHSGVDLRALLRALTGFGRSGASTVSMQLVRLLPSARTTPRTLLGKLCQILGAAVLEEGWTKSQIFEAYLNLVPVRGELRGMSAAAQGLFGKHPSGLGEGESLILAALLRSPSASPEVVSTRACRLAGVLGWPVPCLEISATAERALAHPLPIVSATQFAPHALRRLQRQQQGQVVIRSTVDGALQRQAIEILQRHLLPLYEKRARDGAVLVLDNRTGEVLAYVGNSGTRSSATHIDGVIARRQLGSTLKPFLYGLALDKRYITAASLLQDTPLDVTVLNSVYRPRNYDQQYHGLVPARVALASSLNVPAVRVLQQVGVAPFRDLLRQLGFSRLQSADVYGYSLALGVASHSLWELTNAYRALANGGRVGGPTLLVRSGSARSESVLSPAAAYLVGDILSDRSARALTFGLENVLATPFWSAVKTGTSRDMTDNWCIGFSRDVTVGVWVGNFSGEPMRNVTGIEGAGPIWSEVMRVAHARYGTANDAPPLPVGMVRAGQPGRDPELYLSGTEPQDLTTGARAEVEAGVHILYPQHGMTFAVDGDIPQRAQQIPLQAEGLLPGMKWVMDGTELGDARLGVRWRLVAGKHELVLADRAGGELERVAFVVRGAALR